MKSIGARITIWYAIGATLSFAMLMIVGAIFLESSLTRSLDQLNAAEFRQLLVQIGNDYARVDRKVLAQRLSNVDQYQSVLFYITINEPKTGDTVFSSANLKGNAIPDIKGERRYTADAPGLGPLRVGEFLLPPYDVTVATSAHSLHDGIRAFSLIGGALIVVMLVMSIFVGRGFSRVVLAPLRRIRDTAERIGSDNLRERIPAGRVRDELGELINLLNRMFDRIESGFNHVRQFSRDVSHELKTPLALIRLHAEAIAKDGGEHTEIAIEQIDEIARLDTLIDQMLFLSRADAQAIQFELTAQDPRPFLESFAQDAIALAEHSERRFEIEIRGRGKVAFEASWMRQLLFNLLTNALRAVAPGGLVTLRSSFDVENGRWRVLVADNGPGLTPDECSRIFEPFVRLGARPADRGAGLGLAIARSIATLHQGRIYAEPNQPRGLRVWLELPTHQATAHRKKRPLAPRKRVKCGDYRFVKGSSPNLAW